ncbi:hypothetical protein Q3H58_001689 [Pseudomonas psychrotolerans]|nr:hypothetical protein [Pseudomonas psychrotolerans]
MNARLWVLLVALSLITGTAHAEKLLLEGTLGQATVVVELDPSANDEAYGRYFYDRYRRDLRLSGPAQQGDHLKLEEGAPWQDGPKASWSLARDPAGHWRGTWSGDGKTLPIALAPLQLANGTAADRYRQRLLKDDPYEFRRLQGLTLQPGERQTFMGRGLHWWREPLSGMRLFTVEGASEVANAVLRERLWAEVDAHLGCIGSDGEHSLKVTPQLLTDRILSVNLFSQYSCSGAAHPDFGSAPLTLDLQDRPGAGAGGLPLAGPRQADPTGAGRPLFPGPGGLSGKDPGALADTAVQPPLSRADASTNRWRGLRLSQRRCLAIRALVPDTQGTLPGPDLLPRRAQL